MLYRLSQLIIHVNFLKRDGLLKFSLLKFDSYNFFHYSLVFGLTNVDSIFVAFVAARLLILSVF